MYAAERRRQILDLIHSEASVSVGELAERFGVAPSTIRRDLNQLHRAELLERTYGGAVTGRLSAPEPPFNERSVSFPEEKARIGRAAAALVQPGETIILDGGTTTEAMARALREMSGITVVTFGLNVINALAGAPGISVVAVGGQLQARSLIFGGVLAWDALEAYNLRADRIFLAATGVSAEDGITNYGFDEIPVKRKAMNCAREVVLLADASKVGARSTGFVAAANRMQRLITGASALPEEVAALRQAGIVVDLV